MAAVYLGFRRRARIEIYADFSGQGKNYAQFPDRQSFRIYLEDLRRPAIRERLEAIWRVPLSLDPARVAARVTREIAERLAAVSKALEAANYPAEEVAMFLMRCLFTMFAEDIGLLPSASFRNLLERCEKDPSRFQPMVGQLWEAMDRGGFAYALETDVKQFNGEFFKSRAAVPLKREEIGELRSAAGYDWREVDPSIFGTLLEQALVPSERRRLGAHYTPRAYVERLVIVTVIEPLRHDWAQVLSTAERLKMEGRVDDAASTILAFHNKLCTTRILDPACGTGNFLYVSLELLKRLEGEVLEALADMGGQESLAGLAGHTVDPHQFLGIEINPRAAAIAELVLWIGHLQWHIRTKGNLPSEPILRAYRNIRGNVDAILDAEQTLVRDSYGRPRLKVGADGTPNEVYSYRSIRRPAWPAAEFIVGNPPFVAGQHLREEFGDEHAEALWQLNPHISGGADLVMYWWDYAAELLSRKGTVLRRFGLVTTSSITQEFSGRVVARHLKGREPISLVMAIPNHPWTKATKGAAAVRIAMTVAERGQGDGVLLETLSKEGLDTDEPRITFRQTIGKINPNLTVGVDLTLARRLRANEGICHDGVKLHGRGFVVRSNERELLGLGRRAAAEEVIRPYLNGRDLNQRPRGLYVIDLFGLNEDEVRVRFPEIYQHLLSTVKTQRNQNHRKSYRDLWWIFGEPRAELRPALVGLRRIIATVDTATHRIFQFLPSEIICDDKIVIVASDDSYHLGVLSSRPHLVWALGQRTRLGQGNDPVYVKIRCFSPFPFPDATDEQISAIRSLAEEIDAHRKRVQGDHPDLTLTGIYNVLEKLRSGVTKEDLGPDDHKVYQNGLVLLLLELHDRLDRAVTAAYGWPAGLTDDQILERLLSLNAARAAEERAGVVRWVRPEYQVPKFASIAERAQFELAGAAPGQDATEASSKPSYPRDDVAQTAAVMAVLGSASGPMHADDIAVTFRQGRRVSARINAVLTALARMGYVSPVDSGVSYVLRHAA